MSSQSDYDAYIANLRLRQTIDNALPRARAVQKTIDNLQLDWDENKFLVRALSSAGCDFAWIREKYGGGEALAAALN